VGGGQWPWEAILAVAGLVLTNLATVGRGLFSLFSKADDSSFRMHERGWARASELEEEIRLLRIALHKQQVRGSAYSTLSEILVLAMPLPLEDRIRAVKQAREIAEGYLPISRNGSGG
jgi:hypothetical protein